MSKLLTALEEMSYRELQQMGQKHGIKVFGIKKDKLIEELRNLSTVREELESNQCMPTDLWSQIAKQNTVGEDLCEETLCPTDEQDDLSRHDIGNESAGENIISSDPIQAQNAATVTFENLEEYIKTHAEGVIKDETISKSDKIRILHTLGYERAEIARLLKTHYSFVHRTVRKLEEGSQYKEGISISDQIRILCDKGYTVKEIRDELNIEYSFAYTVSKKYLGVARTSRDTKEKKD